MHCEQRVEHLPRDAAPNHFSGDNILALPDIRNGIEPLLTLFWTAAESADPLRIMAPVIDECPVIMSRSGCLSLPIGSPLFLPISFLANLMQDVVTSQHQLGRGDNGHKIGET
jgi:hypothetical protein